VILSNLESAAATDIGLRETNQDRVFAKTGHISDMPCGLFCVADGMGGLQDGEYAAAKAVEFLDNWWNGFFKENAPKGAEVLDSFFTLFKNINDAIRQHSNNKNIQCGTTCSLLMIQGQAYYIAHVGDSRIYQMEKKLLLPFVPVVSFVKSQQLTKDHSNNGRLTSCLGAFKKPGIFTGTGTVNKPCTFILCSDGFYGAVSDKQLVRAARRLRNCSELANNLVTTALKQGSKDNVSVVAVRFQS